MKVIFICLFISTVLSNVCYSQDTLIRSIPLLKESAEIDSFIKRIANIPINEKASKDDSCLLLNITKHWNTNFIQGLYASNQKRMIFGDGDFEKDKSVGYFEFNNYLIFVYGDEYIKRFFSYTNMKRQFTFIKMTKENFFPMIKGYMSWAIFYRDGYFNYGVH